MRQLTLASQGSFEKYRKPTRREQFLEEMERIVPWSELEGLIEPYYPKGENGRPPMGLSVMLRIYFLQHWFNLSDPAAEEALYLAGTTFAKLCSQLSPERGLPRKFRRTLRRGPA